MATRGRKATGRTTKVIRVPLDFDVSIATQLLYEWLPILLEYESIAESTAASVRSEKLVRLFEELGKIRS
jgi:hypothetical protein